jgi:membrane-bound metal-dependent hydrolase YbcI (DUF457 family)
MRRWPCCRSSRPGICSAGALAFGVGVTLWSQAVIAEVYTLNALFVALTLLALLLWRERRKDRYFLLSAFLVGLSLTNHLTSGATCGTWCSSRSGGRISPL